MAGSNVVGALKVNLGLETAQFTQGLSAAQSGLAKFAGVAKVGAAALVATMVTAGGAVAVAVRGMVNEMDELSKTSQKVGVPVEALGKLKYAAELSDVSLESLSKGLVRLSTNMLGIAQGSGGPAAKALSQLGISATGANNSLRPSQEVFADIAEKFSHMQDGATKTALAVALFGKSGADLIPMLNAGRGGLAAMGDEAAKLGIIIDTQTAQAAEDFNDNLTRLHTAGKGITTQLTAAMLPALSSVAGAMVGAAKNSGFMKAAGDVLGTSFRVLTSILAAFVGTAVGVGLTLGKTGEALWKLAHGDAKGAGDTMKSIVGDIKGVVGAVTDFEKTLWSAPKPLPALNDSLDKTTETITKAGKAAKEAKEPIEKLNTAFDDWQKKLEAEGARAFEESRTPLEQYIEKIKELQTLMDFGNLKGGQDTFDRLSAKWLDELPDEIKDPFGKAVEDALKQAAADDKAWAELQKSAHDHWLDSTKSGIEDGLHALANGNFLQWLGEAIKEKLFSNLADGLTSLLDSNKGSTSGLGTIFSSAASFFSEVPKFAGGGAFAVGQTSIIATWKDGQ